MKENNFLLAALLWAAFFVKREHPIPRTGGTSVGYVYRFSLDSSYKSLTSI